MNDQVKVTESTSEKIDIDFTTSAGFSSFLKTLRCSLNISTYQTGSVFLVGPDVSDTLAIKVIKWKRPMGLFAFDNGFYVGGKFQIWRFNNILPSGTSHQGYDKFYIPQLGWTTGDLDIHDIAVEKSGRILFVNTLYSCISEVSSEHSFTPIWKPPTSGKFLPEDHCHLNGMALRDGVLAYATAFARTDTLQGWRQQKSDGGVLWDTQKHRVILEKLSMPHSPRWHNQKLWLLESGSGRLGMVNLQAKKFEPIVELPGYLRGLTFYGDYAFVGSSIPREGSGITHEPLDNALAAQGRSSACGVFIVDLRTAKVVHFLRISGGVQEIYDIAIIPQSQKPGGLGLEDEDIEFTLNIGTAHKTF